MFRSRWLFAAVVATVAGLLSAGTANAGFALQIKDGAIVLYDSSLNPGDITTNGDGSQEINFTNKTFGEYKIQIVSTYTNTPGQNNFGTIDLQSFRIDRVSATSTSASDLQIILSADGFTTPAPPLTIVTTMDGRYATTGVNGTVGTVDLDAFFNADNTLFGQTSPVAPTTQLNPSDADGAVSGGGYINVGSYSGSGFSLTNIVRVRGLGLDTVVTGGVTTNAVVPAPATAVLALAGAPVLGLFGWMRRRKTNQTLAV